MYHHSIFYVWQKKKKKQKNLKVIDWSQGLSVMFNLKQITLLHSTVKRQKVKKNKQRGSFSG